MKSDLFGDRFTRLLTEWLSQNLQNVKLQLAADGPILPGSISLSSSFVAVCTTESSNLNYCLMGFVLWVIFGQEEDK